MSIHWIIEKARELHKNIYFCFIDYAKPLTVDHNKLWQILQEMEIPDHFTCPLKNLYAGLEATVRTGHGTMDWFQIGKGIRQGCILLPCLFNLYAEYIIWNVGFPGGSVGKNLPANVADTGLIPGLGRSPRGGNDNPLQYSWPENPMDRGACQARVHGVAKSQIQLSD